MSTTLKIKYANEIMENMVKNLSKETYNNILKIASGPALEAYKKSLLLVKNENDLINAWNKHVDSLEKEDLASVESEKKGSIDEAKCLQAEKAKELGLPGYSVPGCADDEQYCDECNCDSEQFDSDSDSDLDLDELEENLDIAANFALNNLYKVATALDNKGYEKLANIVDEAMLKISKKKTEYQVWKNKEEKPPKGAYHKAPKEWFDKMKKDIKKKNPDYSMKRINEIIGDIWDNQLTDRKRQNIYKQYGKTKSPNKP